METKPCSKQLKEGDIVIFFDQFGLEHNALLTAVHGERTITTFKEEGAETITEKVDNPSVNLVMVSPDTKREDTYGRQMERDSSVVHYMNQGAWGNFFCLPEEIEVAREACNKAKAKEFANK